MARQRFYTSSQRYQNRKRKNIGVRIFADGPKVNEWNRRTGDGASNFDVCKTCWRDIQANPAEYVNDKELLAYNGEEGPITGFEDGGESSHPPFDGEDYHCAICGVTLTD